MAVRKIEHVGIMVQSLEKSITFYQDIIGLQCLHILQPSETVRLAFLAFPGAKETEIELVEKSTNSEFPAEGKVHHLAFTVEDIEGEMTRLQSLNLKLIHQQIVTLPNGGRYFFFEGPDGEQLEFFEPAR
ncbi:glyoxalase [Paenibacillus selenitireducens]|uniref:Glyoxalase n=1 Tax=Paenibacillus selenitireducens TaxID=1324314 RepID=A0A1T2XB56_9BACL|nr:VOC family protein [Paenibacillus selenitireducens]OPA76843.1 glyoxalase [Paenibacillus selenitireducens]